MSLPEIVSEQHWLTARRELLVREKNLTRQRDALNADRRRQPMVRITEDYRFTGPDGETSLLDMFQGYRQPPTAAASTTTSTSPWIRRSPRSCSTTATRPN
jgi:predicted dithiol-disulfide oxidoreductase (DUF899 family)